MDSKPKTLKEVEADHMRATLDRYHWNITMTAGLLGISRETMYRKMRRYQLKRSYANV